MPKPDDAEFDNIEELLEHCKKSGLMLFTRYEDRRHHFLVHCGGSYEPAQNDVVQLMGAGAPPVGRRKHVLDDRGIEGFESCVWVTTELFMQIQKGLEKEEEIRRVSTWPIERSFVYVDVSDFSQHKPGQQALIINSLIGLVNDSRYWKPYFPAITELPPEAEICTGDGYIFVFRSPEVAAIFSAHLAQLIEVVVAMKRVPIEFHFRIGAHVGEVYCFWDQGRDKWNYIGDGINGGRRVLDAIGKDADDVVFLSGELKQALQANTRQGGHSSFVLKSLVNRGRRKDKHKKPWRVYEVNHGQLCEESIARIIAYLLDMESREII